MSVIAFRLNGGANGFMNNFLWVKKFGQHCLSTQCSYITLIKILHKNAQNRNVLNCL